MCYSIEPRFKRYVKGYGFLSFAKNIGKNLSNNCSQKLLDSAKLQKLHKKKLIKKYQKKDIYPRRKTRNF